jgi:TonB family protein
MDVAKHMEFEDSVTTRPDRRSIGRFCYGTVAVLVLAVQSCTPPPPVHHFIPEAAEGAPSPVWMSLPPSEIVRITAGPASGSPLPSPPYPGAYDFTDCDSFLPAGVSVAPGTNPTLFRYNLAPDGSVHDASLFRSSGSPDLDNAALACVEKTPRPEAMVAGARAQIAWVGAISWAYPPHGFFEPNPDGGAAAGMCRNWYPPAAILRHRGGDTIIGYRIGKDGNPKDETVVQSSGSTFLDNAARGCVHAFKYYPATEYGEPVALDKSARIEWRLASF